MPVTVKYLMLSMILLSKLTNCDVIAPIATLYRYQLEVNISSVIFHANYLCGCTCVRECVRVCPGDDYVALSATPNPFLLNKICLKVPYGFQSICKQTCKHLVRCTLHILMYMLIFSQSNS